jgi:8-oxo-dGTP diphosphatase
MGNRMRNIGEFGTREDGVTYIPRPGAYAVILRRETEVALVCASGRYHLPGGGIESTEDEIQALRREVVEETGLEITIEGEIGRANQLCGVGPDRKAYVKLCSYYLVLEFHGGRVAASPEHKVEWFTFSDAIRALDHESHAWAVREAKGMLT